MNSQLCCHTCFETKVVFAWFWSRQKRQQWMISKSKNWKISASLWKKIPNANNKDGGTKKHQPHVWPKKQTMWHLAVTKREQELLGGANIASRCTKCTVQVCDWKWDQKVTFCNHVIKFQVRGAVFPDLCMGCSNQVEAIDLVLLQDLNARWGHWSHQNNHFLKPYFSRSKRLRERRFQKGVLIFTMLTSAFLCE